MMKVLASMKDDLWSVEYTADELTCNLAVYPDYDRQARKLMYRIPIENPPPFFQIRIQDLWDRVIIELENSKRTTRHYILTEAAGRIFENVDFRYYHLSVKRRLGVELVP